MFFSAALQRMNEYGKWMDGRDLVSPSQIHQAYYSRGLGVTVITYELIKYLIYFFGQSSSDILMSSKIQNVSDMFRLF